MIVMVVKKGEADVTLFRTKAGTRLKKRVTARTFVIAVAFLKEL